MLSWLQRYRRLQEKRLAPNFLRLLCTGYLGHLQLDAERSSKYATEFAQGIGLFCVVAFPFSFLIEQFLAPSAHSTLMPRVLAAASCTGLIFFTQIRSYSARLAAAYWVLIVGFAGIYTFSTMLILNSAYAGEDSDHLSIWVLQYLVALFVVIQALSSWRLLAPVWILATVASLAHLIWIPDPNWDALRNYVFFPAPIFVTSLVLGALLMQYTKIIQIEKLETAAAVGSTVAHEIRTPLAAIRGFSSGISHNLPELIRVYRCAEDTGSFDTHLSLKKLERIESALSSIIEEVQYSNTIIDMLLVSTADLDFMEFDDTDCSALECVEGCIERFPYSNDIERNMVKMDLKQDFRIAGPNLIVVHVLFNLLKNAIHHSYASETKTVTICIGDENSSRTISVHDTGNGVPKNTKEKVFERFYTTRPPGEGAGIGLSFCRSAMKKMGGTIECESDSQSYSVFYLNFT